MKNSLTKLIYHSFVCKWYKMKTFRGGGSLPTSFTQTTKSTKVAIGK